jgi:serine/threonine-protein kinase
MPLSDAALAHLASVTDRPVVPGGRYEILGRLGQGGMGTVYQARDHLLHREVALKALSAPWLEGTSDSLLREAKVLAALEHPGIVPVHDLGTLEDGRAFYTMRLVRGRRLDRVRAENPALADLLRTFYRVCETVAYAHAKGILHRDIKPQNIMLGPFGEVLLMDWGVAMLLRPATGHAGEREFPVGTRGYMAPEQASSDGGRVDERTDVFALGAVLWFLLEGRAPAGEGGAAAAGPPAPAALRSIAAKAMAPDPAARYATVADLMADTASWMEGRAVGAHAEGLLRRTARVLHRYRVAATLVAAYVVVRILMLLLAGA